MKKIKKVLVLIMIASAMLTATSCGEESKTSTPTTIAGNSSTSATISPTTESQDNGELKVGETGILVDWEITINSVEAKDSIKQSYSSFSPEEGNKFLVVDMTIKNTGTNSETFLPYIAVKNSVKMHLEYKDYTFTASNLMGYKDDLHNKVLNPLSSATGICAFDVAPEVAKSSEVKLIIEYGKQSLIYNLSK